MDDHPTSHDAPDLTAVVHRTIKPGEEAQFEEAMRNFVNFAIGFPGHRGINIIRPAEGGRDYIVVDKFADRQSRDAFTSSPEYQEWMDKLGRHTEGKPKIEELSGLDAWFNRPGEPMRTPPKYKTAVATYIGVCLTVLTLNYVLAPHIRQLPYLGYVLFFNACVVSLLTWVVMPLLTGMLHGWLFTKTKRD